MTVDAPRLPPAPARVWRRLAGVVVGSGLVALMTSPLEPTRAAVLENLLYGECIGLAVFATFMLLLPPRSTRATWTTRTLVFRATVAIPVGFFVGVNVAAALRGRRVGLDAFANVAPVALVLTVAGSAALIYFFWSRHHLAEAAAAQAEAQRTAAEAHLRLLRTQIEPHMLFNTLANLRTLVEVDPSRAQTMIDELIVYLRATLSASRTDATTLAEEFAQLRAYLSLMQVRMGPRLAFALDLPDALANVPIPPMLLQPLVENAIKHGLEPKIAGGSIRVSASADDARVRVEVRDDGVGLDAMEDGYGLTHVRERLAAIHGDAASATLASLPSGGVVAVVELPRAGAR